MARGSSFNQAGAIVRLRLRNFMTYNDVSLEPGSKLNMIIGPNGTGKSAIVCSIIVGLAGDVSLTGRANNIASLVQKGCDWGSSEIELYNPKGKNHVITRKIVMISRAEGKIEQKSEWKLNDNLVPMRTIKKLIEELNIKVDNLCQFLPQDSVASFVKMSPGELLRNTLTAAGDSQLVDDLDKLVKLTDDITNSKLALADLKKASAENEVNARRLETEVQSLQVREELVKKKEICTLKIYYTKYKEALANCDRAKDMLKDKKENLRQQIDCGAPVQARIDRYKTEEAEYRNSAREKMDLLRQITEKINSSATKLQNHQLHCQEAFQKFKRKKDLNEQREQQIGLKQQELDSLKSRLDEIRDVDYTNDIAALKVEAKRVQKLLLDKSDEKNSVRQQLRHLIGQLEERRTKKNELLSIREKRLNFVLGRRNDYRRVVEWLSMNKNSFNKEVTLPMYCDLNIKNPAFADVVEYVINEQDLYSFMCQTEEDLKRFTSHAHDNLKARINVILQPDKSVADFEREARGSEAYRGMRFAGFLKDMVEAPEPIMRYLCGNYGFHRVPIFDELSEPELKRMMDTCPKFFTKKTFYNVQKSRYDQARTIFNEKISESKFLWRCTFDKKSLEELNEQIADLEKQKNELDEKIRSIDNGCSELQLEFQGLDKQCKDLLSKQSERERIERQIGLCEKKLDELKNDIVDIEAERITLQKTVEAIDQTSINDLTAMGNLFGNYNINRKSLILCIMLATLARRNFRLAESSYSEALKKAKELEQQIEEAKARMATLERQVERLLQEAIEKIPTMKGRGVPDKATMRKFSSIEQETVDALESYEEELKAHIQGMQGVAGDQLLNEFNRQNRELADRRKQIDELQESLGIMTAEQSAIKDNFLSQLGEVIRVIDEHYKDFMRKLNYDGKVELAFDADRPDDFSKYGINIMVRYRDNEQLIPLSSTRQSGGERSVATMIYMLALQTKTSVPFRVVDEINQGMDKDNERKVFELLVRTADESSSQYFLVSPKLLSGLAYGDQMKIHIVFNGPQLNFSFKDLKTSDNDEAYASDSPMEEEQEEVVARPVRRVRR